MPVRRPAKGVLEPAGDDGVRVLVVPVARREGRPKARVLRRLAPPDAPARRPHTPRPRAAVGRPVLHVDLDAAELPAAAGREAPVDVVAGRVEGVAGFPAVPGARRVLEALRLTGVVPVGCLVVATEDVEGLPRPPAPHDVAVGVEVARAAQVRPTVTPPESARGRPAPVAGHARRVVAGPRPRRPRPAVRPLVEGRRPLPEVAVGERDGRAVVVLLRPPRGPEGPGPAGRVHPTRRGVVPAVEAADGHTEHAPPVVVLQVGLPAHRLVTVVLAPRPRLGADGLVAPVRGVVLQGDDNRV